MSHDIILAELRSAHVDFEVDVRIHNTLFPGPKKPCFNWSTAPEKICLSVLSAFSTLR